MTDASKDESAPWSLAGYEDTPWSMAAYKQTGVYAILCRSNRKRYIGSARKSFGARWARHQHNLDHNIHPCTHLQNAWNKYGSKDFEFQILDLTTPEQAVQREQEYLDTERAHRSNGEKRLFNVVLDARGSPGSRGEEKSKKIKRYKQEHPETVRRGNQNGARLHPDRVPRGDRSGARLHPEKYLHGDRHWTRTHPDKMQTGKMHWTHRHPEKVARGDATGSRLHPESRPRGDEHHSRLHPENMSRGDQHYTKQHPERIRRGAATGNAKITEAMAQEILYRHAAGEAGSSIERAMGLKKKSVYAIIKRKSWTHVPLVTPPSTYVMPPPNIRCGENAGHVKITEAIARDILRRHARGQSGASIKKELRLDEMGLSDKYVYDVIKRKIWKNIKF